MRAGFVGMFLNEGEKENKRGGGQRQDIGHVCEGEKQEKKRKRNVWIKMK